MSPQRNEDIRRHQVHTTWLDRFDAEHPLLTTVLLTVFLLAGMGMAGWLDAPLVA